MCPVHGKNGNDFNGDIGAGSSVWRWLDMFKRGKDSSSSIGQQGCSATSASMEESARHAQTPYSDQRIRLDTTRQVSSIPRMQQISHHATIVNQDSSFPHHQHDPSVSHWVYPSEQQLYNAMRKKGWSNVPEDSIPVVLQIHNAVNEGTWQQICSWEGTDQIRLVQFRGRPHDLTPLAFLWSRVLRLRSLPFDRHDWYVAPTSVNEQAPEPQRYVIDYYMKDQPNDPTLPPLTFIDVRPALDGPRGFYLRVRYFFQKALPGISGYLQRQWQEPPH